ncbi:MAG: universal stress protein [Streptosporangiaceae bacterium]
MAALSPAVPASRQPAPASRQPVVQWPATGRSGDSVPVPGPSGTTRIVVGVDDSRAGLAALQHAVGMARTAGVPLVAVRAWGLALPRHGGRRRQHRGRAHPHVVLYLDTAQQRAAAAQYVRQAFSAAVGGVPADVPVTIRTPEADPGVTLAALAAGPGDILVLGADAGEHARHLIHGSVSRYCSEHARCPVVLVAPTGEAAL